MTHLHFDITEESAHKRIDVFLAAQCASIFSRSKIKPYIEDGSVKVNGRTVSAHYLTQTGDHISFSFTEKTKESALPENIPLSVIYEDEDLLIINKPAGMVVHPAPGHASQTVVNAVQYYTNQSLSAGSTPDRPGIVHRLDKDTSGLLIIAKNDWIHAHLAALFKKHGIVKTYIVIVKGVIQHDQGKCDLPLGRGKIFRKKIIVTPEGKNAHTEFTVMKRLQGATVLRVTIATGRTHQIRVHMAHSGHPVLGDTLYGHTSRIAHRQCIHAYELEFTHPRTGKHIHVNAPLPEDMEAVITQLSS